MGADCCPHAFASSRIPAAKIPIAVVNNFFMQVLSHWPAVSANHRARELQCTAEPVLYPPSEIVKNSWRLLVGAPCFSRGEMDFSPAEERSNFRWALAPGFLHPGAKAHDRSRAFHGALKRSFPRINAGAPTKKYTPRGHRQQNRLTLRAEFAPLSLLRPSLPLRHPA